MSSYKISLVLIFSMLLGNGVAVARDGNDLLNACEIVMKFSETNQIEGAREEFGYCIGLIRGVTSTVIAYNIHPQHTVLTACLPESGLNVNQSTRIVTSYLKNNPDLLWDYDTLLVLEALIDAFPCE